MKFRVFRHNRTRLTGLLLLCPVALSVVAQRIDIALLETQSKAAPRPERVITLSRAYQDRANWFRKTPRSNLDSAALYVNKAVVLLENTRPLPYQRLAEVYSNLSEYNYWPYGYVGANEMAAKAWSAFENMTKQGKQDRMLQYEILRNQSFAKLETGDPERSLTLMLKALALWQYDANPAVQAKLLANKGCLNDPIIASWYYSLRGNTLSRRNQYDQARSLIQKSLKILETYKLERTHIYQFNMYLLGVIATKKGRYDEAAAYFVKGRELAVTYNFPVSMLQLRISDNGVGKALNSKPQSTGFGTQLVDLLTRPLEGTLQQDIANGTMISIQFKKVRPA